jgi:hypothetical protein
MNPNDRTLTGGRLVAVIAGALIATLAVPVVAAGAALHWLDSKKNNDGYYMTGSERFETSTYALASSDFDMDAGIPFDYGNMRLKVRSDDGGPVFVGVARTRDVDAYLGASAHATLTDLEVDPFSAEYRTTGGDAKPAAPGTQPFWVASAEGAGTQTLTWDIDNGSWTTVVMNADGSPGVKTDVAAGADVPILSDIAWGVTIFGLLMFGGGGALLAGGLISPRRPQTPPLGGSALAA